jgi:cytochrome c peroxidase
MPTLEAQILSNWRGQLAADPTAVAQRLQKVPTYAAHFQRTFQKPAEPSNIAEALAAFVRTRYSGASAWDRYEAGASDAVAAEVIAGSKVFNERADCARCHTPPLYTDLSYHRIVESKDPGRATITRASADRGAFKTPSLRGVARTAPYFHDGRAATLEEVLAVAKHGKIADLSAAERKALRAFLEALSPAPAAYDPPALP